jgi:hypothetical protein
VRVCPLMYPLREPLASSGSNRAAVSSPSPQSPASYCQPPFVNQGQPGKVLTGERLGFPPQLTRNAASLCLLVVTRLAIALTHPPRRPRDVPGRGVCGPTCVSPSLLPVECF